MSDTASVSGVESLTAQGVSLCRGGRHAEAMRVLERAAVAAGSPNDLPPLALASYGMAMAVANRHRHAEAIRICKVALERNPVDADLYHALAVVYMSAGSKRKAVRVIKRGLRVEARHTALNRCLERLGRRSIPCLPFLPRSHPLNKLLGRIRSAVRRRK